MRQLRYYSSWSKTKLFPGISEHSNKLPIVQISNGTFYRRHPVREGQENPPNPPLFPGLSFSIPSCSSRPEHWAVIGPSVSGKTTFLEILRGQHVCVPPTARCFPYLSSPDTGHTEHHFRSPASAVQYVGFAGEGGGINKQGTRGAYLSARYESRREDTDFSVLDYLQGNTTLNSLEDAGVDDNDRLAQVIEDFNLGSLVKMPMGNLSNGQTRRARIAKALLGSPDALLLDEPFSKKDP
jgi:ATPase subunit of ABC transporter with duplicated ATPase domains